MKKHLLFVVALVLAIAPAAFAKNDAMSLIPADAVSVGVVRLADMRNSPLSSALFQQTAHVSMDDDAVKFLRESGLQPTRDVDVIVFTTSPRTALGGEADILIAADGRFNVDRLSSALQSRGATRKSSANGSYLLIPHSDHDHDRGPMVVAFPDAHLAVLGSEGAVIEALASRASGGTTFSSSSGLGRDLARVDPHATAWVVVDVARAQRLAGAPHMGNHGDSAQMIGSALKSMSTVAFWATDAGDSLKLSAIGLSHDSETLGLLEDTIRGGLSALRLAAQDKSPDFVSVLRKFSVSRSDDSVTVSGTVPGDTFRTWVAKSSSAHSSH